MWPLVMQNDRWEIATFVTLLTTFLTHKCWKIQILKHDFFKTKNHLSEMRRAPCKAGHLKEIFVHNFQLLALGIAGHRLRHDFKNVPQHATVLRRCTNFHWISCTKLKEWTQTGNVRARWILYLLLATARLQTIQFRSLRNQWAHRFAECNWIRPRRLTEEDFTIENASDEFKLRGRWVKSLCDKSTF